MAKSIKNTQNNMVLPESTENNNMLTDNIRDAIKKSGLIVKEIATASGVKKSTLDDWLNFRTKAPRVEDLYKVCKVIGITVEEAVAGDEGKVYVRNWVASEGQGYIPPPRIADIVEQLNRLDDKSLLIVKGTLSGIYEGEKDGAEAVKKSNA